MSKLLGRFDNFPISIQGIARFTSATSTQTVQRTIVQVLHSLNKQTVDMRTLTKAAAANCSVNFEFGVADADTFNFLDEEELKKIEKALKTQPFQILDIFCATRYHTTETDGKRRTLKFDYNMLRLVFRGKNIEVFVYHERGNNRIPLEDLVLFIKSRIDSKLSGKNQKPITLKHMHIL